MILCSIFQSVEFYVISVLFAAAVIAAAAKPSLKGAVRTYLYGGTLIDDGRGAEGEEPSIVVSYSEEGHILHLERRGLTGVDFDMGAYSIAVNVAGFDVTIDERLTPGATRNGIENPATGAETDIDCLGPERYHFQYRSESLGRNCSFTLTLRPGVELERKLV